MADAVFIGIGALISTAWIIPLLCLWLFSLCLARTKHGLWRGGIAGIQIVLTLWIISCFSRAVKDRLDIERSIGGYMDDRAVSRGLGNLLAAADFLQTLADMFLMVSFVQVGFGLLPSLECGQPTRNVSRRRRYYAFLVWGLVLLAPSLWELGNRHVHIAHAPYQFYFMLQSPEITATFRGFITYVLWVGSILTVGFASRVAYKARKSPDLRSSAYILLVATKLEFIRLLASMLVTLLSMVVAIFWQAPEHARRRHTLGLVLECIVLPVASSIPMFAILVLLLIIAARRKRASWLQSQPGWESIDAQCTCRVKVTGISLNGAEVEGGAETPRRTG